MKGSIWAHYRFFTKASKYNPFFGNGIGNTYCQTPIPGETWELTLLSCGNKKKKKNKNDPHLNSPRRGCRRVSNFCMGS